MGGHFFKKKEDLIKLYSDIPEALENNYNFHLRFNYKPKKYFFLGLLSGFSIGTVSTYNAGGFFNKSRTPILIAAPVLTTFIVRTKSYKSKDKSEMNRRVEEVLNKVGMKTKGFKYPHELSGGEQQRIAIARALLNNPELILADEPTGNLDPQTSIEVMEVLQDINKNGNTILMATHDYALLLRYPSKTLKCDENQVFEVVQRRN